MTTETPTRKEPDTERQGRTVRLIFRWTPDEAATVTARAAAAGVSVSAYVRAAALGADVAAPAKRRAGAAAPRLDLAEFRQLVGAANNLNQIARALNADRPDLADADLSATLADLRAVLDRYL